MWIRSKKSTQEVRYTNLYFEHCEGACPEVKRGMSNYIWFLVSYYSVLHRMILNFEIINMLGQIPTTDLEAAAEDSVGSGVAIFGTLGR
jgi:hypothetical protein